MSRRMPNDSTRSRSFVRPATDQCSSSRAEGRALQMLFTPRAASTARISSEEPCWVPTFRRGSGGDSGAAPTDQAPSTLAPARRPNARRPKRDPFSSLGVMSAPLRKSAGPGDSASSGGGGRGGLGLEGLDQDLRAPAALLVALAARRGEVVGSALPEPGLRPEEVEGLGGERHEHLEAHLPRAVLHELHHPAADALMLVGRPHAQAGQLALLLLREDVEGDAGHRVAVELEDVVVVE